jgi:hypothetical protein
MKRRRHEIRDWRDDRLIYSGEGETLAAVLVQAANLSWVDLGGEDLGGANLSGANLSRANLSRARDDLYDVLSAAPAEVPGLLAALRAGRVDGSTYDGECACLVGTIANVRGCSYRDLEMMLPNSDRPAEVLFLAIRRGDTPATNPIARITEGWIQEWLLSNPTEVAQ